MRTWLTKPTAIAGFLLLVVAGAAIGGLVGGPAATVVGAGAGLLTAVLLAVAVDRLASALVAPSARDSANGPPPDQSTR
ncbi:hypothetical protein ACRAKI_13665 [Saccharothrix isguenensis]